MTRARLTDEVQQTILKHIRNGNHIAVACAAAGISYNTFKWWMRGGDLRVPNYAPAPNIISFAEAVRKAEAECESEIVDNVRSAAMDDADLGLKFLSRRFPSRWAERKEQLNLNIDWRVKAADMIKRGEVTWELLEGELGSELVGEVRALLSSPEDTPVEEGQFSEIQRDEPEPSIAETTDDPGLQKRRDPGKTRARKSKSKDKAG